MSHLLQTVSQKHTTSLYLLRNWGGIARTCSTWSRLLSGAAKAEAILRSSLRKTDFRPLQVSFALGTGCVGPLSSRMGPLMGLLMGSDMKPGKKRQVKVWGQAPNAPMGRQGSSIALGGITSLSQRYFPRPRLWTWHSSYSYSQHLQGNITVLQLFHAPSSKMSISFKSDLCLTMFGLQTLLTLSLNEERQI